MVVDSRNTAGEAIESARRRFVTDSERALQDHLEEMLNRWGFETTREMVVVPRDRVDIAVYPNADLELLTLIEVKTADPIEEWGKFSAIKPALEYEPFVPGPVRTCPCCDGVGKARPEAIEIFDAMVAEGLLPDNLMKKGNGAGLVTGDL